MYSAQFHHLLAIFKHLNIVFVGILWTPVHRQMWTIVYIIDIMSNENKSKNISKELAAAIRKRRKKLRLSQEEIADRSEIDRSYVNRIECGKASVSVVIAYKIAKALNTSLSRIIKEVENNL